MTDDAKPDDPPRDPQEAAHAERLSKRIKYFEHEAKDRNKRIRRNREYVNGEQHEDGEGGLVRTNLTASVVNTIQPAIYAKAPDVAVQPEERLDPAEYAGLRQFAKTMEMALSKLVIRDGQLKARGKECVRASLTATTGWVKVSYQKDVREDPQIRNRINDAQDNIQRIASLLKDTKDEGQCADYESKLFELRQQVNALNGQVEVTAAEGVVIDVVQPEHMLILDDSVKTIDEYTQASALAHGIYMTVRAYKAKFKADPPKKATRFKVDGDDDDKQAGAARKQIDPEDELVYVYEVWSKDDLTVYTLCKGATEYCRPPFQPQTLGEQWYCFFPLQLWRVNATLYARTLVDAIVELVDEYNTRRTAGASHRRKNWPVRLINKSAGLSNADVDRINGRSLGTDVIAVELDPTQPLQNQLGELAPIQYDPNMYDTSDILRDIEMVSGAQDAARGGIAVKKTATEAEIESQGMQSRTGDMLDAIEDWLAAILRYSAQLLLLNMTPEQIKRRFGESAVWPALAKKDLFELVAIQIRAGTTAKPNKMRERDQWLQFLPQMQDAVMKISELQANGQVDLAQALQKMLEETLRRFDERFSVEEFLPKDGEGGGGMMKAAQAKVQEIVAQAQQALDQQKQELEQRASELDRQQTEAQVSKIQADAAEQVRQAQAQVRDVQASAAATEAKTVQRETLAQIRELIADHKAEVAQMIAAGAQAQVEESTAELQQQIDGIVHANEDRPVFP